MRIDFYHLTAVPLEKVLPSIAERVLGAGERLLVVGASDQLGGLDRQLWTYTPDSFLPHARAGGERDAEQPLLLSSEVEPVNGAANLALADGVWREEAMAFGRVFYLFDAATIDGARAAWRGLKEQSAAERHYWKQDERGRWVEGP
jgi:DNA polymerase III subunit chi